MADILLEVGISVESLKSAQSQINAELASWKTTGTGSDIIDTKKLKSNVEEVKKAMQEIGGTGSSPTASDNFEQVAEGAEKTKSALKNLTETTDFYTKKSEIMKTSLSDVKAELISYLKTESQGTTLDAQANARKQELITSYAKLSKEQTGFFHGINIPRLMLWAVGWKAMYSALNLVINTIAESITSLIDLNDTVDSVRATTDEMGSEFDEKFSKIKDTIIDVTSKGIISLTDMNKAFKALSYEGMNTAQALTALKEVQQLSTITGEKAADVATAVAETYGLWKDKIRGAATEEEKLRAITNYMAAAYTKTGISVNEYQTTLKRAGLAARNLGLDLEYVTKVLIFLDNSMVGGKQATAAVKEMIVELAGDTQKLNETFGIASHDTDTFQMKLSLLKNALDTVGESEFLTQSLEIFPDVQQAQVFIELVKRQNEVLNLQADVEKAVIAINKEKAQVIVAGINKAKTETVGWTKSLTNFFSKVKEVWDQIDIDKAVKVYSVTDEELQKMGWYEKQVIEQERKRLAVVYERYLAEKGSKEDLEKYNAAEKKRNAERVKELEEEKRIRDSFSYNDVELEASTKKQLANAQRKNALTLEELSNSNAVSVAYAQIEDLVQSTIASKTGLNTTEKETLEVQLRQAVATGDITTATKMATVALGSQTEAAEFILSLEEKRLEVNKQIASEVNALADDLQGVTTDFLKDAFSGTIDVSGYLDDIMSTYKDALAENLTQMLGENTGIFASMASSFMSPIQKAHYTGVQNAVPLIIQAHIDGITQGMSGSSSSGGATSVVSSVSGLTKLLGSGSGGTLLSSISDAFETTGDAISDAVSTSTTNSQLTQAYLDAESDALVDILGSVSEANAQETVNAANSTTSLSDAVSSIASAAGGLLTVASFISSMANASDYQGTGNVIGAATSLGVSGGIAGFVAAGAVGAVIGAAAGAIYGAIQAGTSETTTTTEESTIEITSAIEQSNKELQLVNRNLSGLNKGFEGFILAQSAYFSERTSVEAQFNLSSQSGYTG